MILPDKNTGSKDDVATQQCQQGSRFSLSSCSAILNRWCLTVTGQLPWFQASYLHPRMLWAGKKVEVREEEPKSSFSQDCLFGREILSLRVPVECSSPPIGWNRVLWALAKERITLNELDQSCLSLEAGHVNISAQVWRNTEQTVSSMHPGRDWHWGGCSRNAAITGCTSS